MFFKNKRSFIRLTAILILIFMIQMRFDETVSVNDPSAFIKQASSSIDTSFQNDSLDSEYYAFCNHPQLCQNLDSVARDFKSTDARYLLNETLLPNTASIILIDCLRI